MQVQDPSQKRLNVLHKKFDQHEKRHRGGYDVSDCSQWQRISVYPQDALGMILHRTAPVDDFIESQDPVQLLTDCNQLIFTGPYAELYKNHQVFICAARCLRVYLCNNWMASRHLRPRLILALIIMQASSEEVVNCFKDLRVLGRVDFKMLLKWRCVSHMCREMHFMPTNTHQS
jgi:hypothetical protein